MVPPITGPLNEEFVVDTREKAELALKNVSKEEGEILLDVLNKKFGDEKESLESIPELEDSNFRIVSTNWKEITDADGEKMRENSEGDVREYIEGENKGEQLFTKESAEREVAKAGKKMPTGWKTYRDIIAKKYKGNYQKFLIGEKIVFPGFRNAGDGTIVGKDTFRFRTDSSNLFDGNRKDWEPFHESFTSTQHGCSVRCIKK